MNDPLCMAAVPWQDVFSGMSAFFSGVSAVTALLVWWLARRHFKHVRTASYIERYNTAEFTRLRAEVDQFLYLTEKLSPAARGELYKELLLSDHPSDMEFRHKLWTFTMLYNEIGLTWQTKVIDDDLVSNFDRLVPRYWMRLRPYIMNLHLRFGFEVPMDEQGFKSEFKLFKGFRHAYIEICNHKMAIMPQDLETSSLLSKENHTSLEHVMVHGRPDKPCRLGEGTAVMDELRQHGGLPPPSPPNA
jgi:hypothetical protein